MPKEKTIVVDADKLMEQARHKNTDGHLGPVCNNCGGFGFTLTFGGVSNSAGCMKCDQTGVAAMSNTELQKKVIELAQSIHEIKQIILKFTGAGKEQK